MRSGEIHHIFIARYITLVRTGLKYSLNRDLDKKYLLVTSMIYYRGKTSFISMENIISPHQDTLLSTQITFFSLRFWLRFSSSVIFCLNFGS